MRSELTVSWTVLMTSFMVNMLAGYVNCRAVWEEVSFKDYGWDPVETSDDGESVIEIGCFARIPATLVGRTFRLNTSPKVEEELRTRHCIIEVPGSTNINFEEVNLKNPNAFLRLLTGHSHNKPSVASSPLYSDTPPDHAFGIDCNYGFFFVRNLSPEDTIMFTVSDRGFSPDDKFYATEEECMAPRRR